MAPTPWLADHEHYDTEFRDIKAVGQVLERARFEACHFIDCDLTEARWRHGLLRQCRFERCNLSLWQLPYTELAGVAFYDCKLLGVDWTRAASPLLTPAPRLQFERCRLNDDSFFGLSLEALVLRDCQAHEVDFREADLRRADFRGSDLAGSLFGQTRLEGADFSDARDYDLDVLHNRLQGARFSRGEAQRLLLALGIELVD